VDAVKAKEGTNANFKLKKIVKVKVNHLKVLIILINIINMAIHISLGVVRLIIKFVLSVREKIILLQFVKKKKSMFI